MWILGRACFALSACRQHRVMESLEAALQNGMGKRLDCCTGQTGKHERDLLRQITQIKISKWLKHVLALAGVSAARHIPLPTWWKTAPGNPPRIQLLIWGTSLKPMYFISSPLGFQMNNQRGEKGSSTQVCISQDEKCIIKWQWNKPKAQQVPMECLRTRTFWLIITVWFYLSSSHWINRVHQVEEMLLAKKVMKRPHSQPASPSCWETLSRKSTEINIEGLC